MWWSVCLKLQKKPQKNKCYKTPKKQKQKQKFIIMPHNNEQAIDQWVEKNGKTRYQEFDGTERKDDTPYLDGGIVGGLLDNADRDHYRFLTDKIGDQLYNAAADALRHRTLSEAAAKEVAADAIRREVAECKTLYDYHNYDELIEYNLDAALIDYNLGII